MWGTEALLGYREGQSVLVTAKCSHSPRQHLIQSIKHDGWPIIIYLFGDFSMLSHSSRHMQEVRCTQTDRRAEAGCNNKNKKRQCRQIGVKGELERVTKEGEERRGEQTERWMRVHLWCSLGLMCILSHRQTVTHKHTTTKELKHPLRHPPSLYLLSFWWQQHTHSEAVFRACKISCLLHSLSPLSLSPVFLSKPSQINGGGRERGRERKK